MDLAAWLRNLGLEQYEQRFRDNAIDADVLPQLTADDLRDIGVTAVGHRRKLLQAIAELHGAMPLREKRASVCSLAESEGERRQVIVLFADLSSFSALSNELDAEEVHTLLQRFFECADRIVTACGGRVDKHIGDCVMAVFGAPMAYGNDAERAVRAALAIRKAVAELSVELDRRLHVHIGVASGQVVAGGTGSASHREYTVTGGTVNLASRLTEAAVADEILISEPVRRALADRLDCSAIGKLAAKGFAEPLPAWRLHGFRAGYSERRPFVGRGSSLHQFQAVLTACLESGRGQVICLRGEAGIGKTRLVEEFQAIAREAGFVCHAGLILDFGAGIGRDAVRTVVRGLLGLEADSGAAAARVAAAKAIGEGVLGPQDAVFLNDLLNLPQPQELRALYDAMDNATRNRGKRGTLARLVEGVSRTRPRLLIIEDLHWADALVLAQLASLAAAAAACPTVLVMTTRAEGDRLDAAWRAQAGDVQLLTIDLGPLSPAEARALAMLTGTASEGLAARCIERAAGNPLFLQQLLFHAEESQEIAVPGSVQSLVQARLDRLDPARKSALQAASVLGQQFGRSLLAHMLAPSKLEPERLIETLLIRPQGEELLFAHALIRDAIYDTLLKRRRRELHRRAAEWFVGKDLVLHAEHLERAEDPGAVRAYLEAARGQAQYYRYEVARRLVERGADLAEEPSDCFALAWLEGDVLHDLGEMAQARRAYERALEAASDDVERCQARIGLAAVERVTEELDEAFSNLEQAEEVAISQGLNRERARIHFLRGNLYFPRGDNDGCLREHGKSLRLAREARDLELEAAALGGLGDAEYMRGRMMSSHKRLRACVDLCRQHGFGRLEVANHAQAAHAMLYSTPQDECLKEALAAAEAAAKVGHHRAELNARLAATFALRMLARPQACRDEANKAETLIEHLGARRFEQDRLCNLGYVELLEGRRAEAIELLERGLEIARATGITFHGPGLLGVLALADGGSDRSRLALAEAEAVITAGCVGHNQLRFYPLAMELALELRDYDEVERYARALDHFARPEPLPWSDFFVARARALAALGRGERNAALLAELDRLRTEAERLGLKIALPAITGAFAVGQDCQYGHLPL